jgi:hypothetical protein
MGGVERGGRGDQVQFLVAVEGLGQGLKQYGQVCVGGV